MKPHEIQIEGEIDGGTVKAVLAGIKAADDRPLTVVINSPGGYVVDGLEAFSALRDHRPGVTTQVGPRALCASMASVILQAGKNRRVAPDALVMIHEVWTTTTGPASAHETSAKELRELSACLATIYSRRTGRGLDEIRQMMVAETWLRGQEVVASRFADGLLYSEQAFSKPSDVVVVAPTIAPRHGETEEDRMVATIRDYEKLPPLIRAQIQPPPVKRPAQCEERVFRAAWNQFTSIVRKYL